MSSDTNFVILNNGYRAELDQIKQINGAIHALRIERLGAYNSYAEAILKNSKVTDEFHIEVLEHFNFERQEVQFVNRDGSLNKDVRAIAENIITKERDSSGFAYKTEHPMGDKPVKKGCCIIL